MRERYGVEPAQVPDFIALRGDPSDGLPGAPGIGAKTAAELLRAHGSLEAAAGRGAAHARAPAARCARARAAALRENAELLRTFKRIATLQSVDVERPADRATDYAAARAIAARARHAPPRRAAAQRARYGVNLTVITSPSAIT